MNGRQFRGAARLALSAIALLVVAAGSLPAQTSLTFYGDGRVLERRTFALSLPNGVSTHRVPLGALDLTSLFAVDSGVAVIAATYDAALDEMNALRRALGRRLVFLTGGRANGVPDTVVAEVVGVDPERYRLADGRITFQRPGTPMFPAELVLTSPAASLTIRSDRPRSQVALAYFTAGAGWRASYTVTLGKAGGPARVSGLATIGAGPLRADSATVQLLAGTVGRAEKRYSEMALQRGAVAADAMSQEQVGEAHLYTLPGRHSFTPGLETAAMLFEPATAPVERSYTVRGQIPFWGPLPQFGDEMTEPVNVTYTIRRESRNGFGNVPVPAGTARVYDRDAAGNLQLIGEASLGHTAAGQNIALDAGVAFDLTAKRVQTTYTTRRDSSRTHATANYTVTLSNAKDSAVTINVLEQRGGEWEVLSSSIPAERISSGTARFRVRVPARGTATLTYRVRITW